MISVCALRLFLKLGLQLSAEVFGIGRFRGENCFVSQDHDAIDVFAGFGTSGSAPRRPQLFVWISNLDICVSDI